MARKSKKQNNLQVEQLSLFNQEDTELEQLLESDDDWLYDDFGFEESERNIEPQARELLTLKLLREAIQSQHPEDSVMQDFAEYVLPNLLKVAVGVTAKGGKFTDKLEKEKAAKGEVLNRRNATDQSLNTHLLNGLFPANIIE